MNGRRWFAMLAVLSLAFAGCTAPVAPDGGQSGPDAVTNQSEAAADADTAGAVDDASDGDGDAPDGNGDESDGDAAGDESDGGTDDGNSDEDRSDDGERTLPVDTDRVWIRVATMMDTETTQPSLTVGVPSATGDVAFAADRSTFKDALNATASASGASGPRGVTTPLGVYVEPADGPPVVVEQVLAHEYAHSVQYAESMFGHWLTEPVRSTDHELLQTALIEGGATYVGDEYTKRHLSDVALQSTQMRRSYERAAAGDRFFAAPYYFGSRYVDGQIESPANLESVYLDPPATTAELLHGESADDELPLSVSVDASDGDWTETSRDTKGELYTRVALRAALSEETAATAAAGWGNDAAVSFAESRDGDPEAFVWTLRWRTATDADEFVAAFEESLDRRTDDWVARTTVERVGDRTVALVMGPDVFREETTVSGSGGDVTVDVDAEDTGWFRLDGDSGAAADAAAG